MRRFAPFCLLILSMAGFASGAGQAQDLRIKIDCAEGRCSADPPDLKYWPPLIVLDSTEAWTCTINGNAQLPCDTKRLPPESKVAFLMLRSTTSDRHSVILLLAEQERRGVLLHAGSVLAACLAFFVAVLIAWVSSSAGKRAAAEMETVQSQIEGFKTSFESIRTALLFPEPPRVRADYPQAYSESRSESRLDPAADALRKEIGDFIKYVNDCFLGLGSGRRAPGVQGNLQDLERLVQQLGQREVGVEPARAQFKSLAKTLSRYALKATDDDCKQSGGNNPTAEAALQSLVQLAGLHLLTPQQGEPYSETLHDLATESESATGRGRRGCVARVKRRGLLDFSDAVVQKAEVVLYD